ncbi:transcriptional regulator [Rhodococcus sp. NCIMB 12038]|uniref:Rv0361 family membrane protein n=1 Tax=Rhodococcus sp. NCIMB 12038 TaxID=933800 RepID=UPI000B3D10F0|nr:transcriptional regulator [Rhodococcus sp. NCIMB 12038]OUS90098.1 transcriptional regulator [Rhodococcus sp. NCIMB 12038]
MQDPKKDDPTQKPATDAPSGPAAADTTAGKGTSATAKPAKSSQPAPEAKSSPEPKPPQKKAPEKAAEKPVEPQSELPKPPAPRPRAEAPRAGAAPGAKPEEKASEAATTAIPTQTGGRAAPEAATVQMRRTPNTQNQQSQAKAPSGDETVAIPVTRPGVPSTPPPPRPAPQANRPQQPQNGRPVPPPPTPPRPAPAPPKAAPQRVLPPQQSAPQRVAAAEKPSKKHGKAWLFTAIAAGVIVVAAIAVAGIVVYNNNQAENAPEAQVQGTIDTFVAALTQGDLATLRTSTCGSLAEYYQGISDQDFAEVHQVAVTQQNIPVVGGVDAVQITGDTAIAQVKAHTAANPAEQSWRTFNLEKVDGTWKICDPR